jgi:hypothetical protein
MMRVGMVATLSAVAFLVGCAAPNPIELWQARVAEYVTTQGDGDPTVLRDAARDRSRYFDRPALVTIGEIGIPGSGAPFSSAQRDVSGVLLGFRRVAERDWRAYFLVAVVDVLPPSVDAGELDAQIRDVRLVSMSSESEFRWHVSESDEEALEHYLDQRARDRAANGVRAVFPGRLDQYDLEIAGKEVRVTETRSGATWRLPLSALRQ